MRQEDKKKRIARDAEKKEGRGVVGLEQTVLHACYKLKADAYGMTIRREVSAALNREIAPGAIYTTLDRLEDKGLLKSHVGEATPERGNRAKKYFEITGQGIDALLDADRVWTILGRVVEGHAS
jgi:DNA-binding PadR family transcriptional regulator